jgi:hypothetical protein
MDRGLFFRNRRHRVLIKPTCLDQGGNDVLSDTTEHITVQPPGVKHLLLGSAIQSHLEAHDAIHTLTKGTLFGQIDNVERAVH